MPDVSPIQLIILVGYFVPAIVGFARGHHNKWAIFALNLFTAWTFIGWVGALVWALTNPAPKMAGVLPGASGSDVPRFDPATGRPIIGYDPSTGAPILGERSAEPQPPAN